MAGNRPPRKKHTPRYVPKAFNARDPWPLEGAILAVIAGIERRILTVRGLDTLVPWVMLVHRIAHNTSDNAMMAVADGLLRTCNEILARRHPFFVDQDQLTVTAMQFESLESVLPTLIDYIKRAKNSQIMQASDSLMREHRK